MSETLLSDIRATIKSFEHALEATRRDHVGASADLKAVGPSVGAGEVLDGLVRYRFGDNAELMASPTKPTPTRRGGWMVIHRAFGALDDACRALVS